MMQRYLHKTLCLLIQTPSSFLTNYLIITVSSNYSQILLGGVTVGGVALSESNRLWGH